MNRETDETAVLPRITKPTLHASPGTRTRPSTHLRRTYGATSASTPQRRA